MHETVFRNKLILWHGTPESKGEVTNDIAVKTTCESINEIIITVDHIDRSHRIGKYNPKKKNLKPVIVRFTRYNVRVFSNEHKLKGKQVSISETFCFSMFYFKFNFSLTRHLSIFWSLQ